jgi:hypothetical protein
MNAYQLFRGYSNASSLQLVSKCHPLGMFPAMATLNIAATPAELYNTVIVDTPLGTIPNVTQYVLL